MAKTSAEEFVSRVRKDASLRAAYATALKRASEDAMVQVARSAGFDFTVEELRAALQNPTGELSEDQLQQVVGGVGTSNITGDFSDKKL